MIACHVCLALFPVCRCRCCSSLEALSSCCLATCLATLAQQHCCYGRLATFLILGLRGPPTSRNYFWGVFRSCVCCVLRAASGGDNKQFSVVCQLVLGTLQTGKLRVCGQSFACSVCSLVRWPSNWFYVYHNINNNNNNS